MQSILPDSVGAEEEQRMKEESTRREDGRVAMVDEMLQGSPRKPPQVGTQEEGSQGDDCFKLTYFELLIELQFQSKI